MKKLISKNKKKIIYQVDNDKISSAKLTLTKEFEEIGIKIGEDTEVDVSVLKSGGRKFIVIEKC